MQTFQQSYTSATPPAIGTGSGIALQKDPKFTLTAVDKYGQNVTTSSQYGGVNSLKYNIDIRSEGGLMSISGQNIATGIIGPTWTFTQENNAYSFGGTARRNYQVVFKLIETSPSTSSSGVYKVYHNPAQISGFSGVVDGTSGANRITGRIDINLSLLSDQYYTTKKFEIYSGASSLFTPVTGTGAGANMLKSISVFEQKTDYTLSINEGEQPADNSYYYYKVLPYDSFGSGVMSTDTISGLMYSQDQAPVFINTITGKSVVLLNEGTYCIQTLHTGQITGSSYEILDVVANISGNIVSGNYYNSNLDSSAGQQETYPFRTIKYSAQITDSSGVCSSREIMITDNTLSRVSGVSGLYISEYASTDTGNFARFLVSGSGTGVSDYASGTGYIFLMAQVQYPTGSYKLHRTLL